MNTKNFTIYCISSLLLLLFVTVIINRIIDPFWYYRDISINGFNAVKTEYHGYEGQIKPVILRETRPEVVIFSNSYFEIGLNPEHPGLTDKGKFRSYNFGIAGADWVKVYCNVDFAIKHTTLRTVVIGINPLQLPLPDCSTKMEPIGTIEQKTLLFSFDALRASINTLRHQDRPPTHTLNGMSYFHRNNNAQIEQVFKFYLRRQLNFAAKEPCKSPVATEIPAWSYPIDHQDVEGLKHLLILLVNHNVNVKLVVYPNHAMWMELLMGCGDILGRWRSLYDIAKLVEQVNTMHSLVELWDFQGTSDILTERIRNNEVKYWQDIGHFNYEMGDVMLDVIFNRMSTMI